MSGHLYHKRIEMKLERLNEQTITWHTGTPKLEGDYLVKYKGSIHQAVFDRYKTISGEWLTEWMNKVIK